MTKKYTVYALSEPDTGAVRYVGVTSQSVANRKGQIKYGGKRGQFKAVSDWMHQLEAGGRKAVTLRLEVDAPDGMEAERRWIASMRAAGHDLFNKADGGKKNDGWKHTQEWKDENGRRVRGRVLSEETKAKIGAGNTGNSRPDLAARNISKRRLSPDDLTEIRAMLDEGYSMKDIGTSFGVSAGLICMIKSGKRYAS